MAASAGHWPAELLACVRDGLQVLALRHFCAHGVGHAGQGAVAHGFGLVIVARNSHFWRTASDRCCGACSGGRGWLLYSCHGAALVYRRNSDQNPTFLSSGSSGTQPGALSRRDRFQHQQPFWYYLVVVVLAVMPWTVIAARAFFDGLATSAREWRTRHLHAPACSGQPGDVARSFWSFGR